MSAVIVLSGTRTLLYKEVLRFWKVSFQTVAAPVLTAVLYLLIFGHVLEDHVKVYGSVGKARRKSPPQLRLWSNLNDPALPSGRAQ